MAVPTFNLVGDNFIFSNDHLTITAHTELVLPPTPSVTVESVTLTTPHDDALTLPIHDFVVPTPVVEHVFDLLT